MLSFLAWFFLIATHIFVESQPPLVVSSITATPPYNSIGLLSTNCYPTPSKSTPVVKKRSHFYSTGIIIGSGKDKDASGNDKEYDYILTAASNVWRMHSNPNELCDQFFFWAGLNERMAKLFTDLNCPKRPCSVAHTHGPESVSKIWMQPYIDSYKPETNYVVIKWYRSHSKRKFNWQPLTPVIGPVLLTKRGSSKSIKDGMIIAYDGTAKRGQLTTQHGKVKFKQRGPGMYVQNGKELLLKGQSIGGPLVSKTNIKHVIGMLLAPARNGFPANSFLRFTKQSIGYMNAVVNNLLTKKYTFADTDLYINAKAYVEWGDKLKAVRPEQMDKLPFAATGLLYHHCHHDYEAYINKKKRPSAIGVGSVIKSEVDKNGNVYDYILTAAHNIWRPSGSFGTSLPPDPRKTNRPQPTSEQLCKKYEFYLGLNEPKIYQPGDWAKIRNARITHAPGDVVAIYMPYFDATHRSKIPGVTYVNPYANGEGYGEYDWAVIKWKKLATKKSVAEKSSALTVTYYKDWQKQGLKLKTLISAYDPFYPPRIDYDPFGWAYRSMSSTVDVTVRQKLVPRDVKERNWIHPRNEMFVKDGMSGAPLVLKEDIKSNGKQIGILVGVDRNVNRDARYVRITKDYYDDIMKILDGKMTPTFTTGFTAHVDMENYYSIDEDDSGMLVSNYGHMEGIKFQLGLMGSILVLCCGCVGFGLGLLATYVVTTVYKKL